MSFLCYSHDRTLILSSSIDKSIKLWNTNTGKLLKNYINKSLTNKEDLMQIECDIIQNFKTTISVTPHYTMKPYDFLNTLTISITETPLICSNMILLDVHSLSHENELVFIQNGAKKLE